MLGGAEGLLHRPQLLVAEHGFERIEVGVGAQDEDTVELRFLRHLVGIDGEAVPADRLEVPAIAGVADQRLVSLGKLPLQCRDDGGAVGGILGGLLEVAADDIPPPGQGDRLGLVVDLLAALSDDQRRQGFRVGEHQLAH